MGSQRRVQWSGMGMGPLSTSASSLLPKGETGTRGVYLQNVLERSHRGVSVPPVSGEILLRTEMGLGGEEGDPRPFVPEQICQVRSIQDDNCGAGTYPSSPRGFHLFARSVPTLFSTSQSLPGSVLILRLLWVAAGFASERCHSASI